MPNVAGFTSPKCSQIPAMPHTLALRRMYTQLTEQKVVVESSVHVFKGQCDNLLDSTSSKMSSSLAYAEERDREEADSKFSSIACTHFRSYDTETIVASAEGVSDEIFDVFSAFVKISTNS